MAWHSDEHKIEGGKDGDTERWMDCVDDTCTGRWMVEEVVKSEKILKVTLQKSEKINKHSRGS